jgi:LysM repeat protein
MVNRALLARYVAPAAFLLAVTVAVLLVRSTLRSDKPATATTPSRVTTRVRPVATQPRPALKRYYVVRAGDTLDSIARRLDTTVTTLLQLNPGIEPTALRPGQEVRIR